MNKKRFLAVLLAVTMLSSTCVAAEGKNLATREYVVYAFITAIKKEIQNDKTPLSRFTDEYNITEKYAAAVSYAATTGIVKGYEDGSIRPKNAITRCEALVMLARIMNFDNAKAYKAAFSDTPQWAEKEINFLAEKNIVLGYGNGIMGATDNITAEQVGLLAERIGGEKVSVKTGEYGVKIKIVENEEVDYYEKVSRVLSSESLTQSDFSDIYPWSEIRRCNINNNGVENIITYEGEEGFALDGTNGNVFVEIPKFYTKRTVENGYEYRYITALPKEGYSVDPSFVENGKEIEHIYVSAYEADVKEGKMNSVSGAFPHTDLMRAEYIEAARANGRGYGILDARTLMTLQNLFVIEYASLDAQAKIGGGYGKMVQPRERLSAQIEEKQTNRIVVSAEEMSGSFYQAFQDSAIILVNNKTNKIIDEKIVTKIVRGEPEEKYISIYFSGEPVDITKDLYLGNGPQKTGASDGVLSPSGKSKNNLTGADAAYMCAVRYRYMENLWGNVWHYIDGLNLKKGKAYFGMNMEDYNSASEGYIEYPVSMETQFINGTTGGSGETHYIKNLGYASEYPFMALPASCINKGVEELPAEKTLTYRNNHFGDYYYLSTEATLYVHGGGFDHYWRCGLFTMRGWCTEDTHWYLYGSRLIYKPL